MNTGYSKPEVEKPKLTKKEQRTQLHLEARSHANTMEELAKALRLVSLNDRMPAAMEKAAQFLRRLTE